MTESILAITLNPSVDISYPLDHLAIDTVNRVSNVSKTAGGKGLNVARVLHEMGTPVINSGILGGTIGRFIQNQLTANGIKHDFMTIDQESRNCIAILHDDSQQTEILEAGPTLGAQEAADYEAHFKAQLTDVKLITISGSLPKGLAVDTYARLIEIADEKGIPVILDSSGESLKAALNGQVKPYLIKPNQEEIAQLIGKEVTDLTQLQTALTQEAIFKGVDWIVVSLGADGAFVKHDADFYQVTIPKINVVNPVGSGDSTVAGLASAIFNAGNVDRIMKTAMTTGMLNTMEQQTGHVNMTLFDQYYNKVVVKKIN